ncbi:hypothetical protein [Spirosoma aerolatum]|nr:hypothetical protein [Spirosoma aerolatum]
MQRDDTLWKAILEDIFDDFMRFFIPNADEDEFQPRYVDKLVKLFTRNG